MNSRKFLADESFVVVGAGGRIGSAIVSELLAAGARVVAADINQKLVPDWFDVSGPQEDRLIWQFVDISEKLSVERLFRRATEKFGKLHGAVNASYPRNSNYGKHFFDVSLQDFSENLSLHLGGYFLFMQECARYVRDEGIDFSLVNLSSIYGVIAPRFDVYESTGMTMPVEYAATKSAIQHLTRYVSAYMKGTGFRANCVSPGGIADSQPEVFLQKYNAHCKGKGMLDALDVTGTVLFLLSQDSKFLDGQNLIVDDGFTL